MDSATNRFRRQTALRTAHERSSPAGWNLELALFLVDFKIQDDVLATVEAGDRAGRRLGAFLFRVQFIIGIRIQTAEAVAAGVIGVTAADGIGPHVLQKNNAAGNGAVGLIRHHAESLPARKCVAACSSLASSSWLHSKHCASLVRAGFCIDCARLFRETLCADHHYIL